MGKVQLESLKAGLQGSLGCNGEVAADFLQIHGPENMGLACDQGDRRGCDGLPCSRAPVLAG